MINGLTTVCVYDRMIIVSKMCLKYKVEGRHPRRKWLRNKEAEAEKIRRKSGLSSTGSSKGPTDY